MKFYNVCLILLSIFVIAYPSFAQTQCQSLYLMYEKKNNEYEPGYIDCNGKVIASAKFDTATDFYEGFGVVTRRLKDTQNKSQSDSYSFESGIINTEGKIVWLKETLILGEFSEGLALAKTKGKWAFIDSLGKPQIFVPDNVKLDDESPLAFTFENGVAGLVGVEGTYLVNKKGEFIHRKNIIATIGFINDVESVYVKEGFTLIDKKNNYLVSPQKNPINSSDEGFFLVKTTDKKWEYLNERGKKFLTVSYAYAGMFVDGLANIKIDDKWGYMNTKGELVIKPQFDSADYFSKDGLAAVKLNGKYGFINKRGEFVINPEFEYINKTFSEGLAYVQQNGKRGYINKNGKFVWKEQ